MSTRRGRCPHRPVTPSESGGGNPGGRRPRKVRRTPFLPGMAKTPPASLLVLSPAGQRPDGGPDFARKARSRRQGHSAECPRALAPLIGSNPPRGTPAGGTKRRADVGIRPYVRPSPTVPSQARFVDPAWPRHPAGERQRVLGCQSMHLSGAGVEWSTPPTDMGDCKGVSPFARVLLGTFLGGTRKVQTLADCP